MSKGVGCSDLIGRWVELVAVVTLSRLLVPPVIRVVECVQYCSWMLTTTLLVVARYLHISGERLLRPAARSMPSDVNISVAGLQPPVDQTGVTSCLHEQWPSQGRTGISRSPIHKTRKRGRVQLAWCSDYRMMMRGRAFPDPCVSSPFSEG